MTKMNIRYAQKHNALSSVLISTANASSLYSEHTIYSYNISCNTWTYHAHLPNITMHISYPVIFFLFFRNDTNDIMKLAGIYYAAEY